MHRGEVLLITDDVIYARMLALELAEEKIKATVTRTMEIPRNFKGLCVIDADYVEERNIERLTEGFEENIVIFSYGDSKGSSDKIMRFSRPFLIKEFIAAICSLQGGKSVPPEPPAVPASGSKLLLNGNGSIDYCGNTIWLTRREYELLEYLYENRGRPVSRDEAVNNVWNYEFTGNTNVVDVYIRYLREKIDEAIGVKLICTVRNKGYMIK